MRTRELKIRLECVKYQLKKADETNGESLNDIEDWNKLHDEQWDIEEELRNRDLEPYLCEGSYLN